MAEGDGEGKAMRAAGAVHGWESKEGSGAGETAHGSGRNRPPDGQSRRAGPENGMEWLGSLFFPGMVVQHSGGWLARPDELDGRRIRPCPLCARGPRARLRHRDENDVERR